MRKMHEQMSRLYSAARQLNALSGNADQSELARRLNVAPQNVKNWESRGVSKEGLLESQRQLGINATWVETGQGPRYIGGDSAPAIAEAETDVPAGYVRFDQLDVEGSAGPGAQPPTLPVVVQQIDVLETWARETFGTVRPDRIKIISCRGDSMSPTIHDGEIVFVDVSTEAFDRDGIYVLSWGGQLRIKRLVATRDGIAVKSDNPNVLAEHIPAYELDQLTICGRVVAWWRLKKY